MKSLIILLIFITPCKFFSINKIDGTYLYPQNRSHQSDSTLIYKLLDYNYSSFISKPVSFFFKDTFLAKYKRFYFEDMKPRRLTSIVFEYAHGTYIRLHLPSYFKYSDAFSIGKKWDFNMVKKEYVTEIDILVNSKVIKQIFPQNNQKKRE